MLNPFKLVTSAGALTEFGNMARAIQPAMVDPTISREDKRALLNEGVNGLSEKTFKNKIVAEQILVIVNMKEEICRDYPNTEAQVNGVLSWLPRMSQHREMLTDKVKKARQTFGLAV